MLNIHTKYIIKLLYYCLIILYSIGLLITLRKFSVVFELPRNKSLKKKCNTLP